ncbi:glycosyltransferase family 4 protein [Butyrivibrio sp. NC2007]|uniref:glycosyltransferase family 4 protein n=1 Tax=Butyrivibrio sp. NC2007 TaxID=1280683 RepID=UPI0003B73133|nr:glycosyltransferase family 4 protein [Butyrivibrio sp. NC2007]
MKILIVSHEYPPVGGGGANALMHLAKEYSEAGHEVTIVTVWFDGEKKYEEDGRLKIYRLVTNRKHLEHCSFKEMLDYLKKALPVADRLQKEVSYDICQVFFGIPSGPIGYWLKKKYDLPYVIRFGGGDIPGFQDRFTSVYKLIAPAIIAIWKKADALVANSKGLEELALNFYNKKEILIIPNGADVCQESKNSADTEDNSSVRLLFVSRLIERKGLQDIIPLLPEVISICSDEGKNVTLDIVGDGPYRETLEELVKSNNLINNVTFHGQKSKAELPQYYSGADVFLFPSRKEGMPNAVLEAMSYGLPIIMTPCQGSDELIDGNGYVVTAADFGGKILELVKNQKNRKAMGQRSIELVRDVFSWKSTSDKYLNLFSEVIKKNI